MKKLFFLSIAFIGLSICPNYFVNAQGVGINPSGAPPDPSAGLDVNFTNKGTLITRMTTAQRDAITLPATGLLIYNTNCNNLNLYNGSLWVDMAGNAVTGPPAAPTAANNTASQTQVAWNWNTVSGATAYKYNTVDTYSTATDNGTSTSYTQSGLTCNTAYTLYVWAYNNCGNSSSTALNQTTIICGFFCGNVLAISHTIGAVAPETKTVNYGTVTTSLSGASKCWITQNLGADNQAASVNDVTDAAAGWYWQFNRKQGYKVGPTPSWTITSIDENSNWTAANDPCTIELGTGWRIPTSTELFNAMTNGAWSNSTDAYNSVLKLHNAGDFDTDGVLRSRGTKGDYYSSTEEHSSKGRNLDFGSSFIRMDDNLKSAGFTLRCLKD